MADEERMDVLQRLEKGEITAAEAEKILDDREAGVEEDRGTRAEGEFSDITEWSPEGNVTELKIESLVGRITARAGDATIVMATLRARAQDEAAAKKLFDKVELTFDEKDGRAHVKADQTKSIFDFLRGEKVTVDFDVTMPAGAAFVATYGTGPLTTEGLASVKANAGNGKIETDGRHVDVNLGHGKVFSRGARDLEVNGGNVAVLIEGAGDLEKFKFNAGNGKVDLGSLRLPENADYNMHFGNGKVVAEFERRPTNCLITIESLAGKFRADIPFDKEGAKMVYADGEGRARIKVTAANSTVEIKVKEDR